MLRAMFLALVGVGLALSIAASSFGASASGVSAAAEKECASVTEGSAAKDEEACAQGYDGAKAGKTVEQSCDSLGAGAITDTEDVKDCEVGFSVS